MRIGTLYGSSSVIFWYIWNRLPYFSLIVSTPSRLIASLKSRYTARPLSPTPRPSSHDLLGVARRDVARHEVAEARILALEVVVALVLGNLLRRPLVALLLRHPDAAVVAQALAHQRELRLVVAADRNAGRVDLREARVGEEARRACARATPR